MTPMLAALLAHQGGWDELLLTAGLVLAMLAVSRFRRRMPLPPPQTQPDDVCAYCGAALEPDDTLCPSCGFRKRETAG
jgi:hypothetical protein